MRRFLKACTAVLLAGSAGGCATHSTPILPEAKLTPSQRNFEAYWQASLDVLRNYGFKLDSTDRRSGTIITKPMVAQQWFEFWRKDAVTAYDLAEGSMQGVLRKATVTLVALPNKKSGVTRYRPKVKVQVLRPGSGEQVSLTTTGDPYGMFLVPGQDVNVHRQLLSGGSGSAGTQTKAANLARQRETLSGDAALGDKIARQIVRRAQRRLAGRR